MSENFCVAPWSNLHLHPSGSIRPCCISWTSLANTREGGTFESAWNSENMRKLRREFLDGKRPETCKNCFAREAAGVRSVRQELNQRFKDAPLEFTEVAPLSNLRQLDLSFTNDCNLTCRMCGPQCSAKWIGLGKKIPANTNPDLWNFYTSSQWQPFESSAESLLKQLEAFPVLNELEIKGGEPFISKEHDLFLEKLAEDPRMRKLTMRFVTNGTYIAPATLEVLKKFETVKIWVSVDGIGDLYKYIRGGKIPLERVEENLLKFGEAENIQLGILFTLSIYNIFGVSEFLNWYRKMKISIPRLEMVVGMVNGPPHLSVKILPQAVKTAALEMLPDGNGEPLDSIRAALSAPAAETGDTALLAKFTEFTNTMDRVHGQYLEHVEPKFRPLLVNQPNL